MRTITNDYHDAQILNLGAGSERGPYLVTQTGVAPRDAIPKTRMFVLRPDGFWVDFNAYASQGKPEAMDEIVFSTTTQVMETFGKLFGAPTVFSTCPLMKRDLRLGSSVRSMATLWRQLARGRWGIKNAVVSRRRNNFSALNHASQRRYRPSRRTKTSTTMIKQELIPGSQIPNHNL